ncbi:MAG: hypothetical protein ACI9DF_006008, partial [Verrucomicrobiales bacterium]
AVDFSVCERVPKKSAMTEHRPHDRTLVSDHPSFKD